MIDLGAAEALNEPAPDEAVSRDFLALMTGFQGRLYGFVLSLSADPDAANDILQEANIVLWKNWKQFRPGSNFKAWSFRIAHFQYMAYRQKQLRDRLLFSDALLAQLCTEARELDEQHENRIGALEGCLALLAPRSRHAIRMRYTDGLSVADMVERLGRNANGVYQILFRARQALIKCVRDKCPQEGW